MRYAHAKENKGEGEKEMIQENEQQKWAKVGRPPYVLFRRYSVP